MADISINLVDATLGDDNPAVTLGGAGYDYASLRIGEDGSSIRVYGGTGSRPGDLRRLRSLLDKALVMVEQAVNDLP